MDINCEQCGTEHEIDETRLPETAISVRCSSCAHVFTVKKPPPSGFRIHRDGSLLATCPDLATVQRWVSERRLLRSDELEGEGARKPLGSVPELESFFAALDVAQPTAATPSLTAPLFASTNPSFPMPDLSKKPATAEGADVGTDQSAQAVTEIAMPALRLPTASSASATMKFAMPKPDVEQTPVPATTDAAPASSTAAASRFSVPTSPLSAQTVVSARAVAAPTVPPSESVEDTAKAASAQTTPAASQFADSSGSKESQSVAQEADVARAPASSTDDDDLEILAFKQQGRGARRALFVVLLLALIGAVAWFAVKPLLEETVAVDARERTARENKATAKPQDIQVKKPMVEEAEAQTARVEAQPADEKDRTPADATARPVAEKKNARKATPARAQAPKATAKTAMAPAKAFDGLPPPPQGVGVNIDGFLKAGNEHLRRGDMEKAHASFNQAVVARPTHAEAVFLRGVVRFDLGRTNDAIVDLKRSLELSPRFTDAMIVLADAYRTQNDAKNARIWYEKYLETMPNGEDAPAARANLDRLR